MAHPKAQNTCLEFDMLVWSLSCFCLEFEIQSNSVISNMGYNESPLYRTVFHFPSI